MEHTKSKGALSQNSNASVSKTLTSEREPVKQIIKDVPGFV